MVTSKLTCLPKHYKVGEAVKASYLKPEETQIPVVDIQADNHHIPYIFSLRDPDSDDEGEVPVLGKRGRPLVKDKRVTLPKHDLEAAIFSLFQEKKAYKLAELEQRLNHPRSTLKATLKELCEYDFSRKTYQLKYRY